MKRIISFLLAITIVVGIIPHKKLVAASTIERPTKISENVLNQFKFRKTLDLSEGNFKEIPDCEFEFYLTTPKNKELKKYESDMDAYYSLYRLKWYNGDINILYPDVNTLGGGVRFIRLL